MPSPENRAVMACPSARKEAHRGMPHRLIAVAVPKKTEAVRKRHCFAVRAMPCTVPGLRVAVR